MKTHSEQIDKAISPYYHAPDVSKGSQCMRGPDEQTSHMFSYLSPEQRVRADHPLRAIRTMTDRVFAELSLRLTKMYSDIGRPSIPPEQLLRALPVCSRTNTSPSMAHCSKRGRVSRASAARMEGRSRRPMIPAIRR
jgi:hypothetical protein